MDLNIEFQKKLSKLFKRLQNNVKGWYNTEKEFFYYATEDDYIERKSVIRRNAKHYIRNNILNPPNDSWIELSQYYNPPEELEKKYDWAMIHKLASKENNYFEHLLDFNNKLQKELDGLVDLLEAEAGLHEFPLHNVEYLVQSRGKIYQWHLAIFKNLNKPSGDSISNFRKQWMVKEKERANELMKTIDADSQVTLTDAIACQGNLAKYIDYLENNHLNNNEEAIEVGITGLVNNFDFVNINDVYNHFKTSLVDKRYFSNEDLIRFLDYAFDRKQIPEKKFVLKDVQSKQKIIQVFYAYYKNLAGKPARKKKHYAALLGDYFVGYDTQNVSYNFSK